MNDECCVLWIIEKAIKDGGYDGLYNELIGCACTVSEGLAPCDGFQPDCVMGYEIPGTGDYEGTFQVVRYKPSKRVRAEEK